MHGKTGLTGAFGAVGTAGADGKPGLTGASGLLLASTSVMNQSRGFVYIVQPSEIFGDSTNTTWTYLGARATELVGVLPSKIGMFSTDSQSTMSATITSGATAVVVTSDIPPQRFIQNTNDPIDIELPSFPNMTVTSADIHISPYSATSSYRLSAKVCQYILDVTEFQYILHIGAFVHPRIRNDYQVSVTADNTSGGLYNIQCIPTQRNSKVISVLDSIYVSSFDPDKFSLTRIVKLSGIIGKGFVRLSRDRLAILVDGNFTVVEVDVDGAPI